MQSYFQQILLLSQDLIKSHAENQFTTKPQWNSSSDTALFSMNSYVRVFTFIQLF